MRLAAVLLLLALAAGAEEEPDPRDPAIELPRAERTKPPEGKPEHPVLVLNLTKDGEVRVLRRQLVFGERVLAAEFGPVLETFTLDELGVFLDLCKRYYDVKRRVHGKSGLDEVAPGVKASALLVDIRADRRAPWRHVEWLMTILAEQKYYKVRLVARRGEEEIPLDAFLPVDEGIQPVAPEPVSHVYVDVRLQGGPDETAYRFPGQKQPGPKGLADTIETPTKVDLEDAILVGKIRSSPRTPVGEVARVLDLFRASGYEHVHVYSIAIPDPALRQKKKLPVPATNEVPSQVHGTAGLLEDPEEPR